MGLLGLGTIGTGVAQVLLENRENISRRCGCTITLKSACDLDIHRDRGVDFSGVHLTSVASDILDDPEISVVIEVIGGTRPAREFILRALTNGKHVVTSNKEVIAKHGREFLEIAKTKGVNLYYEAAVGGGIPILHGLKNCLAANNIEKVFGIMNGTTNFILTKMHAEGAEFAEVLREAQELGYAEADPTADVDGYDVAYKLSILGGMAFNTHFNYEDIYFEGIRQISSADIRIAGELGFMIKLVAIGIDHGDGTVELRVHPLMIETEHPLAHVNGSFNAVYVEGNYIDECMFYGPGAGKLPTASAVVGDLMDIAMARGLQGFHPSIQTDFTAKKVRPMGEIESAYFLRYLVKDEPGVLADICRICANFAVSLASVHQKEPSGDRAELYMISHRVKEEGVQAAHAQICGLSSVLEAHNLIRVGL